MSQAEKPLNVALIGLGMVAQTHLRAVRDLAPLVQLRGVLATTPDKAKRFAAGAAEDGVHGVKAYANLHELLTDDGLDFAILLTPPNARQAIVEALCSAGLPILMEKPVERDLAAAADILAALLPPACHLQPSTSAALLPRLLPRCLLPQGRRAHLPY